ncbi:hypothetical protein AVEN_27791-1 [Araneus ventricosus]|uniref:Uncharacterized protein n=1 Tax=Araneus ventricosus TaxID=182803 RepID=A0A4Y2EMW7_ARAVE|nr:hypothetical protein AVEN_27791-1 [Araneus ventricosus]
MDVFPTKKSQSLVAVPHQSGKWDAFENLMQRERVQAFISYMVSPTQRIFHHSVQNWTDNLLYRDNFKRCVAESSKVNSFDPSKVSFKKVCKKLKSNPVQTKKTSHQRMCFKMDHLLVVKQLFSFGF